MTRLDPPPTLEQYREMNLKRPLTQDPIGASTAGRRSLDARLGRLVATRPKDGARRKEAA